MSTEQNKATIRHWTEEAWNKGRSAIGHDIYAADYVLHDFSWPIPGPAALIEFLAAYRTGFPDVHADILDMVAEGEKVVWRVRMTGTHRGTFLGIPATGNSFDVEAVIISRFVDGLVVEDHVNYDRLGMMQQLGVIPVPAVT